MFGGVTGLFILLSTKFGTKVGTDNVGNEYYENTTGEYGFGMHRWVEYKVWGFWLIGIILKKEKIQLLFTYLYVS